MTITPYRIRSHSVSVRRRLGPALLVVTVASLLNSTSCRGGFLHHRARAGQHTVRPKADKLRLNIESIELGILRDSRLPSKPNLALRLAVITARAILNFDESLTGFRPTRTSVTYPCTPFLNSANRSPRPPRSSKRFSLSPIISVRCTAISTTPRSARFIFAAGVLHAAKNASYPSASR